MTHNEIVEALNNLCPGKEWSLNGDDYSNLVWSSDGNPPSLQEITAEIAAIPNRLAQIAADKAAAKSAAEAKLAALGLTTDDLAALGL